MMPRARVQIFAVLLLSSSAMSLVMTGSASAVDKPEPWVAKDWTKWTSDDCDKVLNGSPWSHTFNFGAFGRSGSMYTLVQLRSALRVREALLRTLQIQKHYDRMDDQKKQEFDQENAGLLNRENPQEVDILIDNVIVANGERTTIAQAPPAQIALRVSGHSLVPPIRASKTNYPPTQINFDASHIQFEYVFPRTIDGRILLSSRDVLLGIVLGSPLIVDKKTGAVKQQDFRESQGGYTFKVSELMYKGNLEF
jgi:hypothetical protein